MAGASVLLVETLRVEAVEALHPAGEERPGGLDDEVVVRAHQTEGVRAPVAAVDDVREDGEEGAPVVVVSEGESAGDGARRDVVAPVREVAPKLPRHRVECRRAAATGSPPWTNRHALDAGRTRLVRACPGSDPSGRAPSLTRAASTIARVAAIDQLVDELERSYLEVQERTSDPALYNDHREATAVNRRLKELEGPFRLTQEWRAIRADLDDARADPDLRELVPDYETRLAELEEELKLALVERDPADDKDVIVEVRQGVGGDEAALWAADVHRMLARYAERRGFKTEILSTSENEAGGFKEVVFAVKGDGAYSVFKYEGGTHRVQRVPETESQGRIHTSTATVAVMPEVEDIEVELDENDLKVDVYRSTGPGGQSVNTTDSAVRITHVPTGVVVSMQDEKSQLQNRVKALRVLRARLYELERERQQAELSAARRLQIGSGERAEKIRTYNYPDSRVTDHRVKVTLNLEKVLPGALDEFTDALQAEDRRRALETAAV